MNTEAGQPATVLDLPFFAVEVAPATIGSKVAQIFESNPTLPGIMVTEGGGVVGLVARNQFFHRLSRRFGIEVFTPRAITEFLRTLPTPPIVVSDETTIQEAARRCLARPAEEVYDPFIVTVRNAPPRLVDFLALILRQTELLTEAQERLESELAEAAGYVRGLLPEPLAGAISVDWCYHPSSLLGGDGFGYHWLEPDTLALYLLDVSGHGVGSALLSSSVLNVLRRHLLASTDFRQPDAVLEGLNRAFPMEKNNDKYFTIWYGVFHRTSRKLTYASGGHHAAILIPAEGTPAELRTHGPGVGVMPGLTYPADETTVSPRSSLYLFSDGVYEIARPDETWQTWEEFRDSLVADRPSVDAILTRARSLRGRDDFEDDFSLLKIGLD